MSAASTSKRFRFRIRGIVQGVGFRPFVYQLAVREGVGGHVLNDGDGVVIEVEGPPASLEAFERALTASPPPLARIDEVHRDLLAPLGETAFAIRGSESSAAKTMVSPDMAVCDACAAELFDPANRRYRYPLINCTDCGPRYSIIRALPYDRPQTSMAPFAMCPQCAHEYNDPANRRYHAQPISCYECGPHLSLTDASGAAIGTEHDSIDRAAALLAEGRIVAVKGLGGFHLMCDATNGTAVARLRERKRRPSKPLAVMFPSLEMIREAAELSDAEERLILSNTRPIVVVRKKAGLAFGEPVAPGIDRIGVFLPYTPLHLLLMDRLQRPVVATSANISEEPILTDAVQLRDKLGSVVDAVLDVDREIVNACDDSVVTVAGSRTLMLRMARGYAPRSLPLPFEAPGRILAVGANQKSTIALGFDKNIVLSPHIGDLVSVDAFEYFERTLETFKRFYAFEPDIVVCDLHPGYETTKWAKAFHAAHPGTALVRVQHHYAHALACMAEYGLEEPVLAFCFDGTGYGGDKVNGEAGEGTLGYGTLWGGEVLLADPRRFERAYHFRPFRLLGGEQAVREPRRVALSLLFECYSLDDVLAMAHPTVGSFTPAEIRTLHTMWQRGLNAPESSSVGRLFDAVASLTGCAQTLGYEGESGMRLEAEAGTALPGEFAFAVEEGVIDWEPLLRQTLEAPSRAAAGLHAALTGVITEIAQRHPGTPVVLSGGVFQNRTLTAMACAALEKLGIRYYVQCDTPVNDGGVALGQLYHALYRQGGKG
ncbi:carbamoyltransferase HypF [Sulfurimonas sp. HSL-3221]|uniref:carbamoyltransferase HypF n=1 Tax=Thiomicrolovo sulfuroxydans TaxID=2894755 RepID=UPI001E56CBFD|nr:carbamoyltransferase HypF [Sulfurimonas sp. HSL-3221]UFS62491.1 carbamoyltransferase HypF [Sulfurimonas sp. HSL-3221]